MTNISGGPKPTFVKDTVLEALKLNEATRNWVATEVPDDTYGDIGDVVFIPGGPGGAPIGGGKILQVVRETDTESRTTTSASFVDVTGMSVTITPQKSTSAIIVICSVMLSRSSANNGTFFQLADSANNGLSGADTNQLYHGSVELLRTTITTIGYSTPAATSAQTYKARFRVDAGATVTVGNNWMYGQLYAIEVSA